MFHIAISKWSLETKFWYLISKLGIFHLNKKSLCRSNLLHSIHQRYNQNKFPGRRQPNFVHFFPRISTIVPQISSKIMSEVLRINNMGNELQFSLTGIRLSDLNVILIVLERSTGFLRGNLGEFRKVNDIVV